MSMKKTILSLMLVLSSITLAPKQEANAGLLIGLAAGNAGKGAAIGAISSTAVMGGIAATFAVVSVVSGDHEMLLGTGYSIMAAIFVVPVATLLDVSPGPSADSLLQALKARYPFINSIEALGNLTTKIRAKFAAAVAKNPNAANAMIQFTPAETAEALQGASITADQLEQISSDLK